ncbi:uncharacterized protein VDAG_03012 [Verticillium dahliae VdLs.17]|uniref:Basic proline-rich protein n=1 Tax=Verticillium dahliae (strain VdLs.17 / ATCC MYA-4575 / FGSC 10137) TaxID=498257 RepID=G2WZY9_VERDV|nr:uncharacterized protein VDAG_03012 [Verticillium dahliae VdLs.17]EGY21572.1 hypothetical protein VDAG_03012 [Verticillium dahliae VdLs.17]
MGGMEYWGLLPASGGNEEGQVDVGGTCIALILFYRHWPLAAGSGLLLAPSRPSTSQPSNSPPSPPRDNDNLKHSWTWIAVGQPWLTTFTARSVSANTKTETNELSSESAQGQRRTRLLEHSPVTLYSTSSLLPNLERPRYTSTQRHSASQARPASGSPKECSVLSADAASARYTVLRSSDHSGAASRIFTLPAEIPFTTSADPRTLAIRSCLPTVVESVTTSATVDMEPVPEMESLEQFRSSPVPSLRLQSPPTLHSLDTEPLKKPPTIRRSTDPNPSSPNSPTWGVSPAMPYRPRTTSPLSGFHQRSRSAVSLAPQMSRAQSLPGVSGSGHILYTPQLRPSSPSGSPSRVRVARKPVDEAFPTSPVRSSVLDHDRTLPERSLSPVLGSVSSSSATSMASAASRYRRPSSPLRYNGHSATTSVPMLPSTPSSSSSSPLGRAYEISHNSYSTLTPFPSSSVPSTPTSTRSRSPSISSLETIPDSPDAEEAAMEAERIAQLKADAEAAEEGSDTADGKGRSSLDVPTRGRTLGFGSRDKRKRWSVCGAERRGDLDLETIWED